MEVMDAQQFERLTDFVLDIKKTQEEMREILIRNTVVLDEHIRRTIASEDRLDLLETSMVPLNDHVKTVTFVIKFAAGVVTACGTIAGIFEVIRNLHSI